MRLAIYQRVSSPNQVDKESLKQQTLEGKARAKIGGFDNVQIFEDAGKSASSDDFSNRPALVELLSQVKDEEWDAVWVQHSDRLSRSNITTGIIIKELKDAGIPLLVGAGDEYDLSNPDVELVLTIIGAVSRYSALITSQKSKAVKKTMVKEMKGHGGHTIPYGYQKDKDAFIIKNPKEAPVVELIFKRIADGYSYRDVCMELNDKGFRPRVLKEWKHTTIYRMLRNSSYKGVRKYLDEEFDIIPIVSSKLWETANKTVEQRRWKGERKTYSDHYTVKGLLICDECGEPMKPHWIRKNGYAIYNCLTKGCENGGVNHQIIQDAIDSIIEGEHDWESDEFEYNRLVGDIDSSAREFDLDAIKQQQKDVQRKINNLNVKLDADTISVDDFRLEAKKMKAELHRLTELEKSEVDNYEDYVLEEVDEMTPQMKAAAYQKAFQYLSWRKTGWRRGIITIELKYFGFNGGFGGVKYELSFKDKNNVELVNTAYYAHHDNIVKIENEAF